MGKEVEYLGKLSIDDRKYGFWMILKQKFNAILFALFFAETQVCGIITRIIQIPNISVILVALLFSVAFLLNGIEWKAFQQDVLCISIILFF